MNNTLSSTQAYSKNPNLAWPQRHAIGEEEKQAVVELFDECIGSGGPVGYSGAREKAYTEAFSRFMGGGFADAVNSGSNALFTALRALEIEPFHEVIVSPVTDPGGVMPIVLNNLIPIPADVEPGGYNVGAEQIRERITPHTRAIVVAHISGIPADMTGIMELAREHRLPVIEDCSQAHGAIHRGRMAGSFGDIGIFSMMYSKHHSMGGQGGMVFTRSEETYWKIRRASDRGKPYGIEGQNQNVLATLNSNADELACTIGLVQLRKLPGMLERRRAGAAGIHRRCAHLRSVTMLTPHPDDIGSYWFIFFRLHLDKIKAKKAAFVEHLAASGIPFSANYDCQPCRMPWYTGRRVFGSSGYPWSAPQYHGDKEAIHETPNLDESIQTHFMMYFNENITEREVNWIAATLEEAEQKFLL